MNKDQLLDIDDISTAMLMRLPRYYNYLKEKNEEKMEVISSTKMAEDLKLNPILVRKDLALVSSTAGKPRVGFVLDELIDDFETFLGYNNVDDAILVGVGRLGTTLLSYDGFKDYGLNIVAAFDEREDVIHQKVNDKMVFPIEKLSNLVKRLNIHLGIITVPKQCAQDVCDLMIQSGIKAIWNFAPIHLVVPDHIVVKDENMAASLAVLSRKLAKMIK
ncbi:MAG: redox-sensing transcriptional repressor Rex [Bacteroidales bacterium]|nr:redox-sensing transcriptional repressor Rex [Bacteroidales bacterium]